MPTRVEWLRLFWRWVLFPRCRSFDDELAFMRAERAAPRAFVLRTRGRR